MSVDPCIPRRRGPRTLSSGSPWSTSSRLASRLARYLVLPVLPCAAALLVASIARAERGERWEDESAEERGHLDIGFDGEGAIPLGIARSPVGNDVSGGGGFKVRVGDQIRLTRLRITPEFAYGYDHLFATDAFGDSFAWDMHRVIGGVRLGVGRIIVPTVYGHVGYGWRNTGDPTVTQASGVAFDAGFALDLHVIPHFGVGAHAEYAMIDARPFVPQWVALGLHADLAF
jgi:hypothetical protein